MPPGRPRPGSRSIVFVPMLNLHLESNTSTRMIPFRCIHTMCQDPNTRTFRMFYARAATCGAGSASVLTPLAAANHSTIPRRSRLYSKRAEF
jgi:hypothetical protein